MKSPGNFKIQGITAMLQNLLEWPRGGYCLDEIQVNANIDDGNDYIEYDLIISSERPVAVLIIDISIFALSIF